MQIFRLAACAFLLIASSSVHFVSAQKQEFEMFLAGDKIGTLVTDKKVKGNVTVYSLNSVGNAQILWKKVSTVTTYNVVFKDGILTESYFEHRSGGEIEKFCKVTLNGDGGYSINHWKKGKYNLGPVANICLISSNYYDEPKDGQKMFNEGWGEYSGVKRLSPGEYEFKAPDGNKNIYRYKNGKISDAEFHSSIVTIKVRPKA